MGIEVLQFRNESHKKAFFEMVEAMYLSEEEIKRPSDLIKRQLTFTYLIALYQEDYAKYEGDTFYIEMGEELSLGGPTYLLEERYGERVKDYEKIIPIAARILKGEDIEQVIEEENEAIQSFKISIKEVIEQLIIWMRTEVV